MAYVTYLVSINNPNYNLIDENGNTTTSISTTHYYIPIKYNEDAYSNGIFFLCKNCKKEIEIKIKSL